MSRLEIGLAPASFEIVYAPGMVAVTVITPDSIAPKLSAVFVSEAQVRGVIDMLQRACTSAFGASVGAKN